MTTCDNSNRKKSDFNTKLLFKQSLRSTQHSISLTQRNIAVQHNPGGIMFSPKHVWQNKSIELLYNSLFYRWHVWSAKITMQPWIIKFYFESTQAKWFLKVNGIQKQNQQ